MVKRKHVSSYKLNGLSILIILIFSVLFIEAFNEDNTAILVTGFLYIMIGSAFLLLITKQKYKNTMFLFFLFFLFYFLHMSFVHYGLEELYGRINIYPDELWFYSSSNAIIPYLESGYSLFDVLNTYNYSETSAYIYLSGHLAIFANEVGSNSVLVQKLFLVFSASLIPVFVYLILKIFVEEKIAIYGAIFYGLFTHITPISVGILRDIPVALTYIIFFWIVFQKISVKNIFLLLFVLFISYFLRFETGVFLIGMASIYILNSLAYFGKHKFIRKLLIIVIGFVGILVIIKAGLIDMFLDTSARYNEFSGEQAQVGSLGMKLATLPYGLNIVAMTLFGQILPFPAWIAFREFGSLMLFSMISGITWFIVWGYVVYGITKVKILRFIDPRLKYLFYFAIIYIVLLSVTNTSIRRLMAVYPIIFLVSLLTFINISKEKRIKVFIFIVFIYLILISAYMLLKL